MSSILGEAKAQWPQWGGPNRSFTVETEGLADKWPEDGPPKLWYRELGDGYSAIVYDDGVLYTMYRRTRTDEEESTVALDAKTGEIVWEHKIPSPLTKPVEEWGYGPNSTPLIVGNHLYTIGTNAVFRCFEKKTGEVLWTHDLVEESHIPAIEGVGYSSSPMAYKNMMIMAGGRRPSDDAGETSESAESANAARDKSRKDAQTLLAFDQRTGKLMWKDPDFKVGPSSPILINFAGRDQLVLYTGEGIIGVDPNRGGLLWHHTPSRRKA
ncbi:MAG: PQQ-binding-like beta-propeller repeat protein [Phycisphaerales bacterium]|nr:MAG: PQQ-binding-like beta-propeller repeat protein [Phycisphaerales bacterium]